jgi:hypothetical protein
MTTEMFSNLRRLVVAGCLGLLGSMIACSDDGQGEAGDGDGNQTCTPGEMSECACTDGSTSMQTCNEDGMGFGACECGSETGDSNGDGDGDTAGDGDGDGDPTAGDGDGDGEPIGEAPVADIFHPGDGEVRPVDVAIPFIGEATDAEDGALSGMSMVWTSDLDGQIGTGLMFDAPLSTVGMHTITLTATDGDNQQGVDVIQLVIE